jgi:rhodanese-related sulfurtransferase
MSVSTISPKELEEQRRQGKSIELIDVRTPVEFEEVHAEPACLMPLDSLDPKGIIEARNGSRDEPLYVICRTGSRAKQAAEKFREAGFSNVFNVEGGTLAWEAAGLPVVRGKKMMSLERQVRIAAGSLVVIGTALGAFLNPWFLVIPAFVGSGLVFAGVTDTCGMGMMLAKMPWNQVQKEGATCTR